MILLDGPMGTELAARGVALAGRAWSATALDVAPELVRAIHADYAAAGAEVHRTNTFRTQPSVFPDRYRALTAQAIAIARSVNGRIAGSIAPVEDCYRPDLSPPRDIARVAHRAMASAMTGVDLVVCETFPNGDEAAIAVSEAVMAGFETWAALTAGPDASLMTPSAMEDAARACVDAGATAVLVSCTAASVTERYVARLARVGVPFGAYANAGAREDGLGWGRSTSSVDGAAAKYAALAARWIDAGATIVGACCGCGPAHVRALRERFG